MPPEVRAHVRTAPALEAVRLATRYALPRRSSPITPDRVYRSLDRRVATYVRDHPSATYCYEDGAVQTFEAAADHGKVRIYELPIGYWREHRDIMEEEAGRRPEWRDTLPALAEPEWKKERKDRELAFADEVIVPSSFTRRTLGAFPGDLGPVHVVPYGIPPPVAELLEPSAGRRLRALYVGGLTQRKGLADVLEAVRSLHPHVELTIIGNGPVERVPVLASAVREFRWIRRLRHSGVLAEMRRHHVLVLPSLFEGLALVVGEALSQGMAVIATDRTGAPDLFGPDEGGVIVPPSSPLALRQALESLVRNRSRLEHLRRSALDVAARNPWSRYRDRLNDLVANALTA